MKTFIEHSKLPEIKTKKDLDKLISWMKTLDFIGKTPRGMKVEKNALLDIQSTLDKMALFGMELNGNLLNILNFNVTKLNKELVNAKFGSASNKEPSIVTKKYAKYIKQDSRAYSRFLKEIDNIENFLGTLSGIHAKALKGLTIKFVSPKAQKSIAKYVTNDDIIQVNLKKVGNTTEEYGSLRYIILHELGHRYLTMYRQGWDIDAFQWITTKYSTVDSFSGEEKFAELYAISHWPKKYSEYSDKINNFKKTIK